jgi:hypothetical protein
MRKSNQMSRAVGSVWDNYVDSLNPPLVDEYGNPISPQDPNAAPAPARQTLGMDGGGNGLGMGVPGPAQSPFADRYAATGGANPALFALANNAMQGYGENPANGMTQPQSPIPQLSLEDPSAAITASPGPRPLLQTEMPPQRTYRTEARNQGRAMLLGGLLGGLFGGTNGALAAGAGAGQGFEQGSNAIDAERMRRFQLAQQQNNQNYFNDQQTYQDEADKVKAGQAAVQARNANAVAQFGGGLQSHTADFQDVNARNQFVQQNRDFVLRAAGAAADDAARTRQMTLGERQQYITTLLQSPQFLAQVAAIRQFGVQGPLATAFNGVLSGMGVPGPGIAVPGSPNVHAPGGINPLFAETPEQKYTRTNAELLPKDLAVRQQQAANEAAYRNATIGLGYSNLAGENKRASAALAEDKYKADLIYKAAALRAGAKGDLLSSNDPNALRREIASENRTLSGIRTGILAATKAGNKPLTDSEQARYDATMARIEAYQARLDEVTSGSPAPKNQVVPPPSGRGRAPITPSFFGGQGGGYSGNSGATLTPDQP